MANTKTITQNDISFTVDTRSTQYQGWGKKYANLNNVLDGVYDPDGESFGINAIEIDWNGAEITSTVFPAMNTTSNTINTTGDLLSWIKEGIEEAAVSGRISEVVRRSLWIN